MTDHIDVFLGEMKCALRRFQPKPGDVFVISAPREISLVEANEIQRRWKEKVGYDVKVAILADGMTAELAEVTDR